MSEKTQPHPKYDKEFELSVNVADAGARHYAKEHKANAKALSREEEKRYLDTTRFRQGIFNADGLNILKKLVETDKLPSKSLDEVKLSPTGLEDLLLKDTSLLSDGERAAVQHYKQLNTTLLSKEKEIQETKAKQDYDENITASKVSVAKHLDAYTEAARRDAEAHGVEINLPPTQPQ